MLVLTRKIGEKVVIGNCIVIEVLKSHGNRVGLGINAPHEVGIYREEIRDRLGSSVDGNSTVVGSNKSRFFPEFA
jgi:carbon storage regulator